MEKKIIKNLLENTNKNPFLVKKVKYSKLYCEEALLEEIDSFNLGKKELLITSIPQHNIINITKGSLPYDSDFIWAVLYETQYLERAVDEMEKLDFLENYVNHKKIIAIYNYDSFNPSSLEDCEYDFFDEDEDFGSYEDSVSSFDNSSEYQYQVSNPSNKNYPLSVIILE